MFYTFQFKYVIFLYIKWMWDFTVCKKREEGNLLQEGFEPTTVAFHTTVTLCIKPLDIISTKRLPLRHRSKSLWKQHNNTVTSVYVLQYFCFESCVTCLCKSNLPCSLYIIQLSGQMLYCAHSVRYHAKMIENIKKIPQV